MRKSKPKTNTYLPGNTAYLFGNGINRTEGASKDRYEWGNLLEDLNYKFTKNKVQNISLSSEKRADQKEFPFSYDEIVQTSKGFKEAEIKEFIKDKLNELVANPRYTDLPKLRTQEILTSNYDYLFEKSLDSNWKRPPFEKTSETKYSIYRHQYSQNKRVWHIHGEQAMKSSILLGFQHYVDYSSYVRDRANHFMKTTREKKSLNQKPSWVDLFFTHEVNIGGLGMKFSEYPLWWLLAYRNSRKEKGGPVNINNNINYIGLASSLRKNPNLTDALESYGVKVCPVDTDDYDLLYKLVLTNKWKNHLTT